MTPTTLLAIKIAARSLWPLNNLCLVSALAALLVLVVGSPLPGVVRAERVSLRFLEIAILSMWLLLECLLLINLSPDTLLSGLCILQGLIMLVVLCFTLRLFKAKHWLRVNVWLKTLIMVFSKFNFQLLFGYLSVKNLMFAVFCSSLISGYCVGLSFRCDSSVCKLLCKTLFFRVYGWIKNII